MSTQSVIHTKQLTERGETDVLKNSITKQIKRKDKENENSKKIFA